MTSDLHVAAWTLVVGSALFLIGAGLAPEPSRVFTGDRSLYLDVLHRRAGTWRAMNVLMMAGVATTAAGFVALGTVTPEPILAGGVGFTVGSVLWIFALGARATVDVDIAHAAARGEPVPEAFDLWQRATGACFKTYILVAYASLVVAGVAILTHDALPASAGWFDLVFGTLAFAANATGRPTVKGLGPIFDPPFMVHLPTLVMGIAFIGRT